MAKFRTDFAEKGREAKQNIERTKKKLRDALDKALFVGAKKVQNDAIRKAPSDTGMLRNSITVRNLSRKNYVGYRVVVPGKVHYAKFVHDGTGIYAKGGRKTPWVYFDESLDRFVKTSGQKPQPFMQESLDQNREQVTKIIEKAFREVFGK